MDNQPLGTDYLQQIQADMSPKKSLFDNKIILIIGGLVMALVLVLIISALLSSGSTSSSDRSKILYLQLTNLQTNAKKYHDDLKDSNLRAINSELNTQLTNSIRSLNTALTNQKINTAKINKKAKFYLDQTKHNDATLKELTDAKLNAILDRTYSSTMSYELQLILNNINRISTATKSQSYKQTLANITANLQLLQQKFDSFAAKAS